MKGQCLKCAFKKIISRQLAMREEVFVKRKIKDLAEQGYSLEDCIVLKVYVRHSAEVFFRLGKT